MVATSEELLMGEDISVALERIDVRVETLTQVVELRTQTQERDLEQWRLNGLDEHRKLKTCVDDVADQVEQVTETVNRLQQFKSKIIGVGIGLSLIAGTVSAVLVTFITGNGM